MDKPIARMRTPKTTYTVDYPEAIAAAQQQFRMLWPAEELGVYKDEQDIRVRMTEGERHGITEVLKLFTEYELQIGQEFWSTKYVELFPRPDLKRAANAFAFAELNSHAPFYAEINETMGIATDEFYSSWELDPVLKNRMGFIEVGLDSDCPYECLATFSFMEGVVLYSSFSYLKSFNRDGRHMIPHITAGVDSSAKEEHHHFLFSSWSFRQLMKEETELGLIRDHDVERIQAMCRKIAEVVYEHEKRIADLIFSKGEIRHITKDSMTHFIRDRINIVLLGLGCEPMFNQEKGEISEWFYDALSSYKYGDSFAATQLQYSRKWSKPHLAWKPKEAR